MNAILQLSKSQSS